LTLALTVLVDDHPLTCLYARPERWQKKTLKMKVTERALMQRINRKLVHKGETLHTARGERWYSDLGYYYITSNNNLVAGHIKLEELARNSACSRRTRKWPMEN
jgi:hypothetical protein